MAKNTKKYPVSTVAIQNRVRDCYKGFTLDEKRLFVIATPLARVTELFGNEPVYVSAEEFAKETGTDIRTAYKALKEASKRLFDRHFSYIEDDGKSSMVRWTWKTSYSDGGAYLYFTEDVLSVLRQLDKDNPYTRYKRDVVLKLRKDYSLEIYHLAKKHLKMGKFSLEINALFSLLDLPETYRKRMNNLKARVIEPCIDEINEQTDLTLSYENIKLGRKIIGFLFHIEDKNAKKRDSDTIDMLAPFKMTDRQRLSFANKLSRLPELSNRAKGSAGKSFEAFAKQIADELLDPEKQGFYKPYLAKVGFKS